jgi:preprotein translocase subunit SecD
MVLREKGFDIMLKYWRLWLLLIMVVGALLAIILKPHYMGVQVAYVYDTSPAKGVLQQGMIITDVNGENIYNAGEWEKLAKDYMGNITLTVEKKNYKFYVNESGLGIDVMEIDTTNLDFGLDIKGGTRILLQPKENASGEMIDQIIATLQTRANIYGLREVRFFPIKSLDGQHFVQIEAAGLGREVVTELLSKQGNFEAKISKPVFLSNGKGNFQLGEKTYPVELTGNKTIVLSNLTLEPNQTFVMDDIEFEYVNATETGNELLFLGTAYRGEDIELVYSDPQHSGIIPRGQFFSFYFGILVSERGAERFAKITSGIPSQMDLQSGDYYLKDSQIFLYLDNQMVSSLRIASTLGGKIYTTPQIEGSRETREETVKEKLNLQTILRSGALPVSLETVSVGVISPTLGKGFVVSAVYAGLFAAVAVIIVVFARYRKLRVSIPLVFIGLSEIIIILGIAASNDWVVWVPVLMLNALLIGAAWWKKHEVDVLAWIGALLIPILGLLTWTIDLPAIGGIIAAIGVGVDNMIVIADETLTRGGEERKILYTIKDKIKRAFFIIFGSASTTIAAMVPLMSLGVGLVRGFAITTIVGVLVGILITRPAYAKIVEIGTEREKG